MSMTAAWPEAPVEGWLETCATIHMWTQIIGKVRLARAPAENHWWHVALYLTSRGLTTSPIPDGARTFQIDFDFCSHRLDISTSDKRREEMPLTARPLAEFYSEFFQRLAALDIHVRIRPVPVEVAEAIPFPEDGGHADYDPEIAERLWRILLLADGELKRFRQSFVGKASPVHFFWGSFDLALTRFSGRRAPPHPGGVPNLADWVTREAYSHEVASFGFWPGTKGAYERPAFYAYAYPEPPGFADAGVRPEQAFYSAGLKEYLLPYDDVRRLSDPAAATQAFFTSAYEAAAINAHWDRQHLERSKGLS
jgi:hypothetical protein